jgi:hypothetical protein
MGVAMRRISLVALMCVFAGGAAEAQSRTPLTAGEMQALLAKGLVVSSSDMDGGKSFTGRVSLQAGGKLTGTLDVKGHGPVKLDGTWTLKGAQVCRTLGEIQPELVCETWVRTGPKEAIVHVNGKDTGINRW